MEAIRLRKAVKRDGEIVVTGLPFQKGEYVELILVIDHPTLPKRRPLTAKRLLHSGLVGLWKDRTDIEDSTAYARRLREEAQKRRG
jgi:hypothetical protein